MPKAPNPPTLGLPKTSRKTRKAHTLLNHKETVFDCAIIGGGPGGLLAALYLRRYRRNIVLFNSGDSRASWIPKIHNLVGIENAITGATALKRLHKQLRELETLVVKEQVTVSRRQNYFIIKSAKKEFIAKNVILATGVRDIHPAFPNVRELVKAGVVGYCPICDGYDHCDRPIALLTDKSSGLQKINFLSTYCQTLHIVMLKKFELSPFHRALIRQKKAKVHRSKVTSLTHSKNGLKIHFENGHELEAHVGYVSLGVELNDHAYKQIKSLKRTKDGFIRVNSVQRTSIKGLYAVGDCTNDLFQVSVASGHAAIAATDVHNQLEF